MPAISYCGTQCHLSQRDSAIDVGKNYIVRRVAGSSRSSRLNFITQQKVFAASRDISDKQFVNRSPLGVCAIV